MMLAVVDAGNTRDTEHRGPRGRLKGPGVAPDPRAGEPAPEGASARQVPGTVVSLEGRELVIRTDRGAVRARRAASCLLDPAEGDQVLVALIEGAPATTGSLASPVTGSLASAYVLAVLERAAEGEPATLSAQGDLSLRVPAGRFEVLSREGIDLVSAGDVSVTSAGVAIQADEGRFGVERLLVLGRELVAEVASVSAVAGTVSGVFERISQKVKRAYRTVEELDRLRAGRVDYRAEKTMQLSGEDTLVTATSVAKVDGEHIHIG